MIREWLGGVAILLALGILVWIGLALAKRVLVWDERRAFDRRIKRANDEIARRREAAIRSYNR